MKKILSLSIAAVLCLLLVSATVLAGPASRPEPYPDVKSEAFSFTWWQNNGSWQQVTVNGTAYYPNTAVKKYPGILCITGDASRYAKYGFFAVSIPDQDDTEAYRACIEKMITHSYCKDKVGTTGGSWAGAGSMVVASRNPNVGAVVELMGLIANENNIDLAKDIYCPMFFISGENDTLVTPAQTREMCRQLIKSGKKAEHYIVPGQGHGFDSNYNEIVFQKSLDFFYRHLGKE